MRAADRAAQIVITAGGLSVIAAVLGIIIYLGYVTVPLLSSGRADVVAENEIPSHSPLAAAMDEYRSLAVVLDRDGSFHLLRIDSASRLIAEVSRIPLSSGSLGQLDAAVIDQNDGLYAAATDGQLLTGSFTFGASVSSGPPAAAEVDSSAWPIGTRRLIDSRVVERTDTNQYRTTVFRADAAAAVDLPARTVTLDIASARAGPVAAVWLDDDRGRVVVSRRPRGLMAENEAPTLVTMEVPPRLGTAPVVRVVLMLDAQQLVVIDDSGRADRFAIGSRSITRIDDTQLLDEPSDRVTAAGPVLGRGSLVIGTANGDVVGWSIAKDRADAQSQGVMVRTRIEPGLTRAAPIAFTSSLRDRTMFIADKSGGLTSWHATSAKRVFAADTGIKGGASVLAVSPKLDGLLAVGNAQAAMLDLKVGHPEATVSTLFFPVRYEGQAETQFVYQASSAEDDTEPKLSLTPLIFGTIKATVFSMLFALPMAILAAIYTSEFMAERHRRVIKPGIEMMASLPSVVLGFIAAMVVAPVIRDHLTTVLVGLFLAPFAAVIAAGVWGLVPRHRAIKAGPLAMVGMALASGVIGLAAAVWAAPTVERWLFAPSEAEMSVLAGLAEPAEPGERGAIERDGVWFLPIEPADDADRERLDALRNEFGSRGSAVKTWLGGVTGGAWSGWFAIFTPLATIAVGTLGWGILIRSAPGIVDRAVQPIVQVASSLAAGLLVAALVASLLTEAGFDARESILGAFTQRNTLVVGIIMGFAIIPIIYTISDDAMRSVPLSLKAASLGAGATRWQTAVRVVLPVAASGMFSAAMIGLGRAVGETMIVLMATGNTPVMEWNLFSGLRTLSANIAVELPEAERGGTHYRLLFLCGVVLFAMTFVINTTAEIIRQHFRRRNALL